MRTSRLACLIAASSIFALRASACFCFSVPICSHVDELARSHNVFVGRVVEVWPFREAMLQSGRNRSLQSLKKTILARWNGVLSDQERQEIGLTQDQGLLELRFGAMQRVRFAVTEVLSGTRVSEVYTDATSCGFRFETGRTYFVVSGAGGRRSQVSACSRTSLVESDEAVQDLGAMRAWKTGTPMLARIYGRIDSVDQRNDTRISLVGNLEERTGLIDGQGRFSFEGLSNATYELRVEDARGSGGRIIDLAHFGCFEAFPYFNSSYVSPDEKWRIAGSPVPLGGPEPGLPVPPPLSFPH